MVATQEPDLRVSVWLPEPLAVACPGRHNVALLVAPLLTSSRHQDQQSCPCIILSALLDLFCFFRLYSQRHYLEPT